jgi:hypothetical protein
LSNVTGVGNGDWGSIGGGLGMVLVLVLGVLG